METHRPTYFTLPRFFPRYRWWRPVAEALIATTLWALMILAVFVPLIIATVIADTSALTAGMLNGSVDMTDPLTFSITLLSLAFLIPAVLLSVAIAGRRPVASVISLSLRFRWRVFLRAGAIAVVFFLLLNVASWVWDGVDLTAPDSRAWLMRGSEGAIALHAANNTVICAGAAVGLVDPNSTDISPDLTLLSIGVTALTAILIIWDYTHQRADQQRPLRAV